MSQRPVNSSSAASTVEANSSQLVSFGFTVRVRSNSATRRRRVTLSSLSHTCRGARSRPWARNAASTSDWLMPRPNVR